MAHRETKKGHIDTYIYDPAAKGNLKNYTIVVHKPGAANPYEPEVELATGPGGAALALAGVVYHAHGSLTTEVEPGKRVGVQKGGVALIKLAADLPQGSFITADGNGEGVAGADSTDSIGVLEKDAVAGEVASVKLFER